MASGLITLVLALVAAPLALAENEAARGTTGAPTDAPAAPSEPAPSPEAATAAATPALEATGAAEDSAAAPSAPVFKPRFGPHPLPDLSKSASRRVVVVPLHGEIDLGLVPFVDRAIEEAAGAALIVLDVDTFGGRIDAAVKIRDALLATEIPTLAFVNRRAISAGALISLAADHLVFAPGGSMGAATPVTVEGGEVSPVGEKMTSYMRSEMRASAEATNRDPQLAEAMVDASIVIEGVSDADQLLTVTTKEALALALADAEAPTLDALLGLLGLEGVAAEKVEPNWAESAARFLTSPAVAGILMALGMLGLFVELKSPGVGLPGAVGLLCLSLFFGGHLITALAGWEELVLFFVGFCLLIAEIFVIPGFGIAGLMGIAGVVGALVLAMFAAPVDVAWETGEITGLLWRVIASLTGSIVGLGLIARWLPRSRFSGGLVLTTTLGDKVAGTARVMGEKDYTAAPTELARWLGATGVAITDLRMAGKARLHGEVVDVVSQTEYLNKGTPVRVVLVEGMRVVVIADTAPDAPAPSAPQTPESST